MARATVIIPTFGNAGFARWAIKSVQNQNVKDLEICIICDGSPEPVVSFFKDMGKEDPRIQVFVFPKSPRTGEPYRDIVIGETTGSIICYCSHDDVWFPDHVQTMEHSLRTCWFTHSLHADVNPAVSYSDTSDWLRSVNWVDLNHTAIDTMKGGLNYFGLTFGAHTRDSYYRLPERWTTTPGNDMPTDLYMWCKFLSEFENRCRTVVKITALCFPRVLRKEWSEKQRDNELREYFERIQKPGFVKGLHRQALRFCPSAGLKLKFLINNRVLFRTPYYPGR